MNPTMKIPLVALALLAASVLGGLGYAAEPVQKMDVYYFGNSFTGNTAPALHEKLGASAGKQWSNLANLGAGWPIWNHLFHLRQGTKGGMSLANGEWTLNPEFKGKNYHASTFYNKITLPQGAAPITIDCVQIAGAPQQDGAAKP